jgi:hypothetical protein
MLLKSFSELKESIIFGVVVTFSTNCAMADSDISQFIEKMRMKSPPVGTRNSMVTRVCGEFRILNEYGKEIHVQMAGSTHEWDTELDKNDVGTSKVTSAELNFLKNCLKPENKKCDLLVEQGDEPTEGNLLPKMRVLNLSKSVADKLEFERLAIFKDREQTEMHEMSRLFRSNGKNVINFDLQGNVDALTYIYKNEGEDAAFQAMDATLRPFFEPKNPQHQFPHELAALAEKIIQSSELRDKIKAGQFSKWVSNPDRKFDVRTDAKREQYMVYQIQNQKKDICILAHTLHIASIVERLSPKIKEFKILKTELGRDGKAVPEVTPGGASVK